jgi:nicotinamidase-related amidase
MNTALLLIDIQNDYFPGGRYPLDHPEEAAMQAARLLAFFRSRRMPVCHVQHLGGSNAPFFVPETKGAEIHPSVAPLSNEPVVIKHSPDSFFETSLRHLLQENHIEALTVCGMMTHMCIDTTVRAARNFGYPVTVIGDACACRSLEWNGLTIPADMVQAAFLASLQGSFANVLSAEAWLSQQNIG